MDLQLNGRIAVVAGSSRGIGKAIAYALLKEGCKVCVTGRDEAALDATTTEFGGEFGERVRNFPGDLTGPSVVDSVARDIAQAWGPPEILIANLGSGSGKPGWQQDESEWRRLFELNFFGSVRLAEAFIPLMKGRGGVILFIASIVAVEATQAPLPYSAAKSALVNYSKNLSRLLADDNIRVNCIAPGNVLFPGGSWDRHLQNRREFVEKYVAAEVPQNRFGTPQEIASLAAYLVSPISAFTTGGCYIVDGGQTRGI